MLIITEFLQYNLYKDLLMGKIQTNDHAFHLSFYKNFLENFPD